MAKNYQESRDQCAAVYWFKMQYPKYQDCIIAIPNGSHLAGTAKQRAVKMAIMKKEGLKTGASDLFIAIPLHGFSGLWLEMKAEGETYCKVKENQREHIALMIDVGYAATWAAGFETAMKIIKNYMEGKPL